MRLIDYFDRDADLYPDRHCLHDGRLIGALPRSPVGKVLKKKTLRESYWAGRARKIMSARDARGPEEHQE